MKAKHIDEHLVALVTTSAPQDIARQDAASFEVYRQLRDDIVNCRIRPNERLRFDALRTQYSAGVGTLREALSHLVSDGLVRTEAGRGFRVAPVSVPDLLDITEWRVEFEVRAVKQSIQYGDDAWEAEVVTACHMLLLAEFPPPDAPAEAWQSYGARHKRFHDAIASACRSPWLLHFRSVLFDQARRYQALSMARREPKGSRSNDDHKLIMKAVIDRDTPRATRLIEQHVRLTADFVLKELAASETAIDAPSSTSVPAKKRGRPASTKNATPKRASAKDKAK